MKSNRLHPESRDTHDQEQLLAQMKREKEALVTMFLGNASISELAEQYKRIDDLHARMSNTSPER